MTTFAGDAAVCFMAGAGDVPVLSVPSCVGAEGRRDKRKSDGKDGLLHVEVLGVFLVDVCVCVCVCVVFSVGAGELK